MYFSLSEFCPPQTSHMLVLPLGSHALGPVWRSLSSVATACGRAGVGCWPPALTGGEGDMRVALRAEAQTP